MALAIPPGLPGSLIRWMSPYFLFNTFLLFDIDFDVLRAYGLLHRELVTDFTRTREEYDALEGYD